MSRHGMAAVNTALAIASTAAAAFEAAARGAARDAELEADGVSGDARIDGLVGLGVSIGHGAVVAEGAVVGEGAAIGYGAIIGPGAIVGPGTSIGYGAVVARGAAVGEETFVGPMAYVGDGARVGDGAYIGRNAVIGDRAHVRSLAAVGAGALAKTGRVVTAADAELVLTHDLEEEADEDALPTVLAAYVPVVFQLDLKVLTALELLHERGIEVVESGAWRACATAAYRARWAIALAGPEGLALETIVGTATAGGLIYRASTGRIPNFYAATDEALEDIRRCAERQQWPWLVPS